MKPAEALDLTVQTPRDMKQLCMAEAQNHPHHMLSCRVIPVDIVSEEAAVSPGTPIPVVIRGRVVLDSIYRHYFPALVSHKS